ncbi:MAG: hypothetical protein QOG13_2687 [Sphingomonadales bacterium]|nr:hypothetical protein [Sphingomonadales bacterium]
MAAREHRVSRRVLLGAACAVPVLSAAEGLIPPAPSPSKGHPGLDPGSIFSPFAPQGRWTPDRVRGDEAGVQDDERSCAVTKWDRAVATFRRAEAVINAAAHEPDQDRYDALNLAFFRALRRLIRTPAPDLPALSLKIELAVDHEVAELTGGDHCLAALKRDARRLAASRA